MTAAGALYAGHVLHRRLRPRVHALRYRVLHMLIDIDRAGELAGSLRLFSHNRFGLFAFHDRDHGAGDGTPLRLHAENLLRAADARAQAQTESARAGVAAFKALGGGWKAPEALAAK